MPTRSTTTWRRGDVVLVPIGFTDQSGAKRRPAVIVSSDDDNARSPDVMIASITSNLLAIRHPGDHLIRDWQAAGLLRPSLAQTKIATVEAAIIDRRLGRLSGDDLAALDRPDATPRKEPRHADADLWKVGERRDRPQEGGLVPIALGLAPLLLGVNPDVDEVVFGFGREDDRGFTGRHRAWGAHRAGSAPRLRVESWLSARA